MTKRGTFRMTDKPYLYISSIFSVSSLCQVSFRFKYKETDYGWSLLCVKMKSLFFFSTLKKKVMVLISWVKKLTTFSPEQTHAVGEAAQCVNTGRKSPGDPVCLSPTLSGRALPVSGTLFGLLSVTEIGFEWGPGINASDREGKATLHVWSSIVCRKCDFCLKVWPACLLSGRGDRNGERSHWTSTACPQRPSDILVM